MIYWSVSIMTILQARYEILRSCMAELQRVGILAAESYSPLPYAMLSPASMVRSSCYRCSELAY